MLETYKYSEQFESKQEFLDSFENVSEFDLDDEKGRILFLSLGQFGYEKISGVANDEIKKHVSELGIETNTRKGENELLKIENTIKTLFFKYVMFFRSFGLETNSKQFFPDKKICRKS